MRTWLLAILGGLALAPIGGAVVLIVAYTLAAWRGITEHEGRRGMLAFMAAVLAGVPLGFWTGWRLAWWMCGGVSWGRFGIGALLGVGGLVLGGAAGLVAGARLAEDRGVSIAEGRWAWSLRRVALPATVAGGAAGFMAGWALWQV